MIEMKTTEETLKEQTKNIIAEAKKACSSGDDYENILKNLLDYMEKFEENSGNVILEIVNTTIGNKTVLEDMIRVFNFSELKELINTLISHNIKGQELLDPFVKKGWHGCTPLATLLVKHHGHALELLNIFIENGAPTQKLLECFKIRDDFGMTAFMALGRYHHPNKLLSLVKNLRELIMQDISVLTPIIIGEVKFSKKEAFFHDFVIPALYTLDKLPDDILAYFRSEQGKSVLLNMLKTYQPSPEVMGAIRGNINDIKTPLGRIVNFHRPIIDIGNGEVKLDPNNPKTWTNTYKKLNAKFGLSVAHIEYKLKMLHDAIAQGDLNLINHDTREVFFGRASAEPNESELRCRTMAVHYAICCEQPIIVNHLFKRFTTETNDFKKVTIDKYTQAIVHYIKSGNFQIIEFLLEHDIDVNQIVSFDGEEMPLLKVVLLTGHHTNWENHSKLVDLLLEHGVRIDDLSNHNYDQSIFQLKVKKHQSNYMLQKKEKLLEAIEQGNLDTVEAYAAQNITWLTCALKRPDNSNFHKKTQHAADVAVEKGQTKVLIWIHARSQQDPILQQSICWAKMLTHAIECGNHEISQYILDSVGNILELGQFDRPLLETLETYSREFDRSDYISLVDKSLNIGASLIQQATVYPVHSYLRQKQQQLHYAISHGDLNTVKLYVEQNISWLLCYLNDYQTAVDYKPAAHLAAEYNQTRILEYIIDVLAANTMIDENNHYVIRRNQINYPVSLVISRDCNGFTPACYSAFHENQSAYTNFVTYMKELNCADEHNQGLETCKEITINHLKENKLVGRTYMNLLRKYPEFVLYLKEARGRNSIYTNQSAIDIISINPRAIDFLFADQRITHLIHQAVVEKPSSISSLLATATLLEGNVNKHFATLLSFVRAAVTSFHKKAPFEEYPDRGSDHRKKKNKRKRENWKQTQCIPQIQPNENNIIKIIPTMKYTRHYCYSSGGCYDSIRITGFDEKLLLFISGNAAFYGLLQQPQNYPLAQQNYVRIGTTNVVHYSIAQNNLAHIYMTEEQHDHDKAMTASNEAISSAEQYFNSHPSASFTKDLLSKHYMTAQNRLAEIYKIQSQYHNAQTACENAITFAEQYLNNNPADDAIKKIIVEQYIVAQDKLIDIHFAQSQYNDAQIVGENAIKFAEQYLDNNPADDSTKKLFIGHCAETQYKLMIINTIQNQYEAAKAACEKTIAFGVKYLANNPSDGSKWRHFQELFKECVDEHLPRLTLGAIEAQNKLVQSYLDKNQPEEAKIACEKIIIFAAQYLKNNPVDDSIKKLIIEQYIVAQDKLIGIHLAQNQYGEAKEACKKTIALRIQYLANNPSDGSKRRHIHGFFKECGVDEHLLRFTLGVIEAQNKLVQSYLDKNQPEQAKIAYGKIIIFAELYLNSKPTDDSKQKLIIEQYIEAQHKLIDIHLAHKQYEAAKAACENAIIFACQYFENNPADGSKRRHIQRFFKECVDERLPRLTLAAIEAQNKLVQSCLDKNQPEEAKKACEKIITFAQKYLENDPSKAKTDKGIFIDELRQNAKKVLSTRFKQRDENTVPVPPVLKLKR